MPATGVVAGELLAVSAIFAVPALGALLLAARLGVRSRPLLCIYALAGPCLIGYAAIGLYLASATFGRIATLALYVAAALGTGWLLLTAGSDGRRSLRWWAGVGALSVAAAALALGMGFLRGGVEGVGGILATAQVRYTGWLPADAKLPYFFAQQLLAAHRPLPHVLDAGWLSSDRPPLQTGLYLLVRAIVPYSDPNALLYQVTGTLLQSLWVPAVWCFFGAVRLDRRGATCGVVVIATSGFVIVNSFFVWPKLFPAAFVVLLAAAVLTDEWRAVRRSALGGLACGVAAGLALLGHEGSVLVLVPLAAIVLVAWRRWPAWRYVVPALVAVAALMLPWVLYQQLYDPPGNQLTKLQLAGAIDPGKSLVGAVTGAYDRLDARQIAHDKWTNLLTPLDHEAQEVRSLGDLATNYFATGGPAAARRTAAVTELRQLSFFYLLPATGLVALGLPALLLMWRRRRARGPDMVAAGRVVALLAGTFVFWALVLFGPSSTVIHQGSYATVLLLFGVAMVGLWRLSHRLAVALTVVQSGLGLLVYNVFSAWFPNTAPPVGRVDAGELVLMLVGLAALVGLGLMLGPAPSIGGSEELAPPTSQPVETVQVTSVAPPGATVTCAP